MSTFNAFDEASRFLDEHWGQPRDEVLPKLSALLRRARIEGISRGAHEAAYGLGVIAGLAEMKDGDER